MELLKLWSGRTALVLMVAALAVGLVYIFPADVAFLFAIDLATYVEAAVVVFTAAQVTKVRPLVAVIRARFMRPLSRRRSSHQRVTKPRRTTSNEDLPGPGLAWAI
jgi:hypothetical protein